MDNSVRLWDLARITTELDPESDGNVPSSLSLCVRVCVFVFVCACACVCVCVCVRIAAKSARTEVSVLEERAELKLVDGEGDSVRGVDRGSQAEKGVTVEL